VWTQARQQSTTRAARKGVREFAVRMAVGASFGNILRDVIRPAVMLLSAGLGAGSIVTLLLLRRYGNLLGVTDPMDPVSLAGAPLRRTRQLYFDCNELRSFSPLRGHSDNAGCSLVSAGVLQDLLACDRPAAAEQHHGNSIHTHAPPKLQRQGGVCAFCSSGKLSNRLAINRPATGFEPRASRPEATTSINKANWPVSAHLWPAPHVVSTCDGLAFLSIIPENSRLVSRTL
jgi:hypothetical protein